MPFDKQPVLKGKLVELRPLRSEDHDDLYAAAGDPLIWEQHPDRNRHSEAGFREFFREAMASGGALLVIDAETRRVIGSSRFHGYDQDRSEIEIGWTFLARSHWGTRYNGELKELMLRHAFKSVDSVVLFVSPGNLRSQRAVEKMGGILGAPDAEGRLVYRITALPESRRLRVILIGGSSSVGKSTLAASLAGKLGWTCISTDQLGRHPGRPWRTEEKCVPEHVAEHYLSLSVEELVADVLRHYRGMWPGIEAMICSHANEPSTDRLILEGSALWPESVATLTRDSVAAVWLTASDDLFRTRIHELSRFEEGSGREKRMVQKFLERTHRYNEQMMEAVRRLGLDSLDVEAVPSLDEQCDALLELARQDG